MTKKHPFQIFFRLVDPISHKVQLEKKERVTTSFIPCNKLAVDQYDVGRGF